ncbi:Hypothetical protein CINCED_3A009459 [Cinara cedri]|nr:Hypothetical protein CINCED_3A009459 [Cinara cedri]
MRAKDLVYHVECFACYACGTALCKGDYYGVRDGAVFCRADYERLKHRDMCELEPMCSPPRAAGHHWPSVHKGRPRKKRNSVQVQSSMAAGAAAECNGLTELNVLRIPQSTLEIMQATDLSSSMESLTYETSSLSSPTNSSTMGGGGGGGGMTQQQQQQQARTKRMRTSFKHHQLRTMKSYFNINQNPDAKDLKQLAQKTGLSKRVLQVWFQNARAKWRRNIMRQENSQMVTGSMSNQNQTAPSDPDLIRGHTQGLNFVDLF